MAEILEFINNTDTVEINDSGSIVLIGWEPSLPAKRETIHAPIYDNGSNLISRQFDNVIETFTLAIVGANQNSVATNLRNLVSILEAGVSYHIGLKSTPTYLRAKSNSETNTRYAIVKNYKLEKIPQTMGPSPFNTGVISHGTVYPAGLVQIVLAVEVQMWQSQPPGSYDTVLASGYNTFGGNLYGTIDGSGEVVELSPAFIANRYNIANLDVIFNFDASGSSYAAVSSYPASLFPNPISTSDVMYFGCKVSTAHSGPFCNIAFNLSTVATSPMTLDWEYWSGATWDTIPTAVYDGTVGFSVSGHRVVTFKQPSGWAATTINSQNCFWVRARISNLNGNSTRPVQATKIYATTWPYIEIDEAQVEGDISPLVRHIIKRVSYTLEELGRATKIVMGLRTKSRGSDFMSVWNASDEQNPSGLVFSPGTGSTLSANMTYPTGKIMSGVTIADSSHEMIGEWTVSSDYSNHYIGRFRAFLILQITAKTGSPEAEDISLYLTIKSPDTSSPDLISQTEYRSPPGVTLNDRYSMDMGEVEFSGPETGEATDNPITLSVYGFTSTSGMDADIALIQLELIPADEWSCEIVSKPPPQGVSTPITETDSNGTQVTYLDLDATKKRSLTVMTKSSSTNAVSSMPIYNSAILPIFQVNTTQRLYFLVMSDGGEISTDAVLDITTSQVKRYLTPRGSD